MLRIGLRFFGIRAGTQNQLDRFVFRLMRREARDKRHTAGALAAVPSQDRRRAHRIVPEPGEPTAVIEALVDDDPATLTEQAAAALHGPATEPTEARVRDISTAGCALEVDAAPPGLERGAILRLRLRAEGLDIQLRGEVRYVAEI